jgi:hypothetical protein
VVVEFVAMAPTSRDVRNVYTVRLHLDTPVDGAECGGNVIHLQGWAHDADSPVGTVTIVFDDVPLARAGLTWPRPDVAEGFGDPGMGLCGFDRVLTLPPSLRTPGLHTVAVEARLLDGRRARTSPVTVELPVLPLLPEEHAAPRRRRSEGADQPIHSVWLARSLDQGGSQLRMAETLEHLAGLGWKTTVLATGEGPLRARLERVGVEVRLVDPVPFDDAAGYQRSVRTLVGQLADADLAVAPTVTSFPLVHAARLAGVPAVQRIGEEAPLPTVVAWLIGRLDLEVEEHARRAISGAAAIWTNAQSVADAYRVQEYGDRFAVISTGAPRRDPATLQSRAEARGRIGLPLDRRVMVFAGTIWPVKGQGMLVEAMRVLRHEHPELLIALVGYDQNAYAGHLRDYVTAHDLTDTVIVAPFHDDLTTWWAAADAVALTPTSPSEALSGALVEGMAHGLPALASRAGDSAVMVEDGRSGWLCDADDLGSLVDALRRAATTDLPTLRAYGERAALRSASEGDRETALARAAGLLEACVDRSALSPAS